MTTQFHLFSLGIIPPASQWLEQSKQLDRRQVIFLVLAGLAGYVLVKSLSSYKNLRHVQTWPEFSITPPSLPSILTPIGNTIWFLLSPGTIISFATTYGRIQTPVRIDTATESVYVVQGKDYITSLWKVSSKSRALALHTFVFKRWFAMPQKLVNKYLADDSGYGPRSHAQSTISPQNRTDRLSHLVFKDVLSGLDMHGLYERFTLRLCEALTGLKIGDQWTSFPDLVEFFERASTVANTESLWGTDLTKDSKFCDDHWNFVHNLIWFTLRLPRWLVPKAFARRDRLLKSLRQWQVSGPSDAVASWEKDGYDPLRSGSKNLRKWETEFLQMDDADADGLASVHLTFSWAANINLGPASFWATLEIFQRPDLLAEVRSRLPQAQSLADAISLLNQPQTRARICADPLLQSIYAETLRLRVSACIVRRFPHDVVDLQGWKIPRDQLCIVSTQPAHMHGDAWNTDGGRKPLDQFWESRFLVPKVRDMGDSAAAKQSPDDAWTFSLRGLEGMWIPFGGGPRACPGRHVAKHHMLITMAAVVMLFDIRIEADGRSLRMSDGKYGLGTLVPVGKIPFKVRRRL